MVKQINSAEFNEKLAAKEKMVVDFYADWCGPCKEMAPKLDELSEKNTNANFYKMNIEENMDVARTYKVMSIPNICFFENGELKDRIIGAVDIFEVEKRI